MTISVEMKSLSCCPFFLLDCCRLVSDIFFNIEAVNEVNHVNILYSFVVAVGILMVLARIRNQKRKKQLSQSRKKSVKKSVNRNDEGRFTGDISYLKKRA
jgi:hypothetical protein